MSVKRVLSFAFIALFCFLLASCISVNTVSDGKDKNTASSADTTSQTKESSAQDPTNTPTQTPVDSTQASAGQSKTPAETADPAEKTSDAQTSDPSLPTGHEHIFGDWEVAREATCEENGEEARVCTICGAKETKSIPATGHTLTVTSAVAPTCTTEGKTEGLVCVVCGKAVQPASTILPLGHKFGDATVIWGSDYSAQANRTCTVCGFAEPLGVTVTSKVTKEATCQKTGEKVYTASVTVDGSVQTVKTTQTLEKAPHSFGEPTFIWMNYTATETHTCAVCGYTEESDAEIIEEITQPATCTDAGVKTYTAFATLNGETYTAVKTQKIAAEGHSFGAYTQTKAPSCSLDGEKTRKCSKCGTTETKVIDARHSFVGGVCSICHKEIGTGDIYVFGSYEQDNILENGKEEIEWIVLSVDNGAAKLLSKYALDTQCYNRVIDYADWLTCSLHSWLNEEFYNSAFSASEKSRIGTIAYGDTVTSDHVALPSYAEVLNSAFGFAETIGKKDSARRCTPTDYALAQGCLTIKNGDYAGCCWWWLSSPSNIYGAAMRVNADGSVPNLSTGGANIDTDGYGVRPMIFVIL